MRRPRPRRWRSVSGAWILTRNGSQVDLEVFSPSSISVLDVAAALSKINRFNGHTSRLYSVAEHSLHVVTVMERELHITDPGALYAGLLHDAHEAYVQDLSTPLKTLLGAEWASVERRAQISVLQRFDALEHFMLHHSAIKVADLTMLATERRDLMPATGPQWAVLRGVEPLPYFELSEFDAMECDDWRDAFIERFSELRQAAKEQA